MNSAVIKLVDTIHHFYNGSISFDEAESQAYELFMGVEIVLEDKSFGLFFSVLVEYFFDPARKARSILHHKEISKDELLFAHRCIRESKLAKAVFLSNRYPRSLLIKSAKNLLDFMRHNPQYLQKILRGEMAGPMMLEIHPTDAICTYRCQMCIWCGGQKHRNPIADFYGNEPLLTSDQWCKILDEVKGLGTRQIIFSGGGETLLSQSKIKPVLDKANSIGLETMIYTNGRTLCDLNQGLLDSVLRSTWLRISVHAATPEVYSKLINRPFEANDFEAVVNGIRKIVSLKKRRDKKLKVGIGIVLQELNYGEVDRMAKLCSELEIDFLDVRVDCIGVTKKLSTCQYKEMLESLCALRLQIENDQLDFTVSFADDLLIAMGKWEDLELTQPKRCLISLVRPAIDPFGIVGACDSIGEPYTRSKSPREYVLGQITDSSSFSDIMLNASRNELGIHCKFCMPGQISLNALLEKLVDDYRIGIEPFDQPFCF